MTWYILPSAKKASRMRVQAILARNSGQLVIVSMQDYLNAMLAPNQPHDRPTLQ